VGLQSKTRPWGHYQAKLIKGIHSFICWASADSFKRVTVPNFTISRNHAAARRDPDMLDATLHGRGACIAGCDAD
jgi:hypothetical protein